MFFFLVYSFFCVFCSFLPRQFPIRFAECQVNRLRGIFLRHWQILDKYRRAMRNNLTRDACGGGRWMTHPPRVLSSLIGIYFFFPLLPLLSLLSHVRFLRASWRKVARVCSGKKVCVGICIYIYICIYVYSSTLNKRNSLVKNRVQHRGSDCSIAGGVHVHAKHACTSVYVKQHIRSLFTCSTKFISFPFPSTVLTLFLFASLTSARSFSFSCMFCFFFLFSARIFRPPLTFLSLHSRNITHRQGKHPAREVEATPRRKPMRRFRDHLDFIRDLSRPGTMGRRPDNRAVRAA